jgi:hypothetical protein
MQVISAIRGPKHGISLTFAEHVIYLNMDRRYYVYAYLNPITNEPFYIGAGHGRRASEHLHPSVRRAKDTPFHREISLLEYCGVTPYIFIIKAELTEAEARASEAFLIHLIGTRTSHTGPLRNLAAGKKPEGFTLREGGHLMYTRIGSPLHPESIKPSLRPAWNSKRTLCWGEVFPSRLSIARDARCIVSEDTLKGRLRKGWPIEEAATTLPHRRRNTLPT